MELTANLSLLSGLRGGAGRRDQLDQASFSLDDLQRQSPAFFGGLGERRFGHRRRAARIKGSALEKYPQDAERI